MVSTDFASFIAAAALTQDQGTVAPVPGAKANENATATPTSQGVPPPTGGGGQQQPTGLFGPSFIWIMLGMVAIMLIFSSGGRKQEKQRKAMLATLKRNDRVQTIGGVLGTVIELNDHDVLLRVDEGSNTRIRFARSAIQQILREAKEPAKGDVEAKPRSETAPVK
jgi:preprotein translocase subunit YajC